MFTTGVDDVGDSHQQTEQRYMVAEIFSHKRDVAAPRHDCIEAERSCAHKKLCPLSSIASGKNENIAKRIGI